MPSGANCPFCVLLGYKPAVMNLIISGFQCVYTGVFVHKFTIINIYLLYQSINIFQDVIVISSNFLCIVNRAVSFS